MSEADLPKLSGVTRRRVLAAFVAAHRQAPTRENFYLVCVALSSPLIYWAGRSEADGVLPSEILERVEEGLRRKKRYLPFFVTRFLKRRARQARAEREGLSFLEEAPQGEVLSSDPALAQLIQRAAAALDPKQRETIEQLMQGYSAQELAELRAISPEAAWQQISRARKAFQDLLRDDS